MGLTSGNPGRPPRLRLHNMARRHLPQQTNNLTVIDETKRDSRVYQPLTAGPTSPSDMTISSHMITSRKRR
jgi:hypothetical protein